MDEEYECLVIAMHCADALIEALGDDDETADDRLYLHKFRNRLNDRRVHALGGGAGRPFHVSDLRLT